jgi:hypothetical protein
VIPRANTPTGGARARSRSVLLPRGRWRVRGSHADARGAAGDQAPDVAGAGVGDRARGRVGLLAFVGIGLLVASGLLERLERLEDDSGIGWVNLFLAMLIATIVVCTAALVGDSVLTAAERRKGRRPGTRLMTPLLAVCGGAAASGILIDHLRHPLALDGWIALGGSLLLAIAAVAHHRLPDAATPRER